MAKGRKTPFEVLRDFEKRSLIHAVGLPEQAKASGTWSGISFRLGDANLVSDIGDIVEILTMPPLTLVPGAKHWMLGVANVRGNLVPIVDLRAFLTGELSTTDKYSRVLVIPQQGGQVGVLIDEVTGQRHFLDEEQSDDKFFNEHMVGPYVAVEYQKAGAYWGRFDVSRLINNPEFSQAAA